MNHNLYETTSSKENPMRITRLVSVILNGVVFSKLASRNDNNVDAMAASLMGNLPHTVKKTIRNHELSQVNHSLRAEIGQRMSVSDAE
jgi:hypothetical protein